MSNLDLAAWKPLLAPHVVSVALCGARLIPVALLCPLLGGISAPTSVRLGVALSFGLAVHFAGGLTVGAVPHSAWVMAGWMLKELSHFDTPYDEEESPFL